MNIELICPLCQMPEDYFNHPVETICDFTARIFNVFQYIWFLWTKFQIPKLWWDDLWIPSNYPFRDQLFYAVLTLRRKVWHNYTSTLYDNDKFISEKSIIFCWIGNLQWLIQSILYIINNDKKLPQIEKNLKSYLWSLDHTWTILHENKWKIISLNTKKFFKFFDGF